MARQHAGTTTIRFCVQSVLGIGLGSCGVGTLGGAGAKGGGGGAGGMHAPVEAEVGVGNVGVGHANNASGVYATAEFAAAAPDSIVGRYLSPRKDKAKREAAKAASPKTKKTNSSSSNNSKSRKGGISSGGDRLAAAAATSASLTRGMVSFLRKGYMTDEQVCVCVYVCVYVCVCAYVCVRCV